MKVTVLTFALLTVTHYNYSLGQEENGIFTKAQNYLLRFGYLRQGQMQQRHFRNAIKDFQEFTGLEKTGEPNMQTINMMDTPRYCKELDKLEEIHGHGSLGQLKIIKYSIRNRAEISINEAEIENEVKQAAELWSSHSNIKLVADYCSPVHIEIRIGERLDKNILADIDICDTCDVGKFIIDKPIYIKINDQIFWTKDNFYATVVHHLGHALGLGHTSVNTCAMYPYVGNLVGNSLHKYDVKTVTALHGRNKDITDIDIICNDPKFDTVFTVPNGTIYIFKDENYWTHDGDKIVDGPKSICENWLGLPCLQMDAAYTYKDKKTYFFRKATVWVFNHMGYPAEPQPMSPTYSRIPADIDTAVPWNINNLVYFFKENKYWGYDSQESGEKVHPLYPYEINRWTGIPGNDLEAALSIGAYIYFFKAPYYYKYSIEKDTAESGYPKNITEWLRC